MVRLIILTWALLPNNFGFLARKLRDCEDTIAKVERTVDYQENQSRRCNLRFDGIPDAENETWEQAEKQVRREMTTSLELPETQVRAMTIERIESPDHRGQIRPVQRPRARACGGQEKTTSWNICERRLLAENYGETQRTSPQNDESTRRRKDRLPVV